MPHRAHFVAKGGYIRQGVNAFFAEFALNEFTSAKLAALLEDPNEHVIASENDVGIDGFIRLIQGKEAPVSGCSTMEISTLTCHWLAQNVATKVL